MDPDEVKKRKACSACTRAKAKCSPFGNGMDICQRCERLNKECIYEDSARRRGPRTRSRMKQLEQRVESLMGMLATNGRPPDWPSTEKSAASLPQPIPDTSNIFAGVQDGPPSSYLTPEESPNRPAADAFVAYDPVDAGVLDEEQAIVCLQEFRDSFCQQFPFVIVDYHLDVKVLRQQQPFLFLSIMTVTTYRTPTIQRILAEEFRDQVATRIIGHAHKGLELLQGLLVHTAFYHFFYRPGKQQLTLMVQLCVAAVQDLGVSRNIRAHRSTDPIKSVVERRAVLGTYYLAAEFARTWRKRTTMPYTRAMASYCQLFSERAEVASDALIAPLVRLTELMCRINDYFSYDEIAYSEITGEATLDLSTNNFRIELQHLQDSMPELVRNNTTVGLTCDVLSVWIHECSLHSALWNDPQSTVTMPITQTRARMLQRTLNASQAYVRKLIATPSSTLHHFPFPIWGSWFYSTLVVVKLIFLHDNGGNVALGMDSVPCEVGNLLPQDDDDSGAQNVYKMTASLSTTTIRDSALAAREAEIIPTFQAFIEKMLAAAPDTQDDAPTDKSLLIMIATLQQGLLAGLKKRIEKQSTKVSSGITTPAATSSGTPSSGPVDIAGELDQQTYSQSQSQPVPFIDALIYTDIEKTTLGYPQQPQFDDWMWDLVMEDVNMFTV